MLALKVELARHDAVPTLVFDEVDSGIGGAVAAAVGRGPGVVVAGDLLDLAMLSVHDVGKAVILVLHGDDDYYYDLAVKHEAVVHAYVAYSLCMHERLLERLPHRAASILHLPYGIPLPSRVRRPGPGPLRLIFAGRIEHGQKGVLDLPAIDAALRARGADVATVEWPEGAIDLDTEDAVRAFGQASY